MCKILKPNDWNLKSLVLFIIILYGIYLTRFLFSFMNIMNIEYSILWKIIGFLSITFIPGLLLLKILKVHHLSSIETLLYSIGLSLTFIMIMGLFMNIFYPLIGIMEPFSEEFLIPTFSLFTFVLCLLAYIVDKDFKSSEHLFNSELSFHPLTLFFLSIPLISILGTYFMNNYSNNILQLLTLILIGLALLLFDRIPSKLYPLTLFIISISLLFHKSLISNYVHGWDIQLAYRVSEATQLNNYWDISTTTPYNSLLAFPVLSTIYSKVCAINIHWVYKIIYSFLFSLAPVGLFYFYKSAFDDFDDKWALLSTFVFVFYYQFNSNIADKQCIAELFFIFLLILISTDKINYFVKSLFAIIFSFAIIQSHYGLNYIIIFAFIFSYILLVFIFKDKTQNRLIIKSTHIILLIVMSYSWYLYASSGIVFKSFIYNMEYTYYCISSIFVQTEPRTGISVVSEKTNIIYEINLLLFLLLSFWILIGVFQNYYAMYKRQKLSEKKFREYSFLPLFFFLLLFISFFVSGGMGVDRIYQISLLILAPFSVFGFQLFVNKLIQPLSILKISTKTKPISFNSTKLFSIYLLLFFLFNSGLMYYTNNIHISSNFNIDKYSEYSAYNEEEMSSALWLKTHSNNVNLTELKNNTGNFYSEEFHPEGIYTDWLALPLFDVIYDPRFVHPIGNYIIPKDQYYCKRQIEEYKINGLIVNNYILENVSDDQDRIYQNNKVEIYKF